jgi:hypothetical protein
MQKLTTAVDGLPGGQVLPTAAATGQGFLLPVLQHGGSGPTTTTMAARPNRPTPRPRHPRAGGGRSKVGRHVHHSPPQQELVSLGGWVGKRGSGGGVAASDQQQQQPRVEAGQSRVLVWDVEVQPSSPLMSGTEGSFSSLLGLPFSQEEEVEWPLMPSIEDLLTDNCDFGQMPISWGDIVD